MGRKLKDVCGQIWDAFQMSDYHCKALDVQVGSWYLSMEGSLNQKVVTDANLSLFYTDTKAGGFMQDEQPDPVREAFDRVVNPKQDDSKVSLTATEAEEKRRTFVDIYENWLTLNHATRNPDYSDLPAMTACHGQPKSGADDEAEAVREAFWASAISDETADKIRVGWLGGSTPPITPANVAKCATEVDACALLDFIESNQIPYIEGTIIALVAGHAAKRRGKQDIELAIHLLRKVLNGRY